LARLSGLNERCLRRRNQAHNFNIVSSIPKTLSVVGLTWLAMSVQAKVATISIGELARESDLILVSKVRRVEVEAGVKIARVRVIRFVKGEAECPIAFVAEPTWTCDTSAAVPGPVR